MARQGPLEAVKGKVGQWINSALHVCVRDERGSLTASALCTAAAGAAWWWFLSDSLDPHSLVTDSVSICMFVCLSVCLSPLLSLYVYIVASAR